MDVGCYYLPGNRSAPPPGHLVHGSTGHTEEEQSPFDPLPYGWCLGGGAMKMTKFSVNLTPVWPVPGRRRNETVLIAIKETETPVVTSLCLHSLAATHSKNSLLI